MFSAFLEKPLHIQFAEQEKDEKIELLLRQHFIVNLPWIFMAILGLIFPFLVGEVDRLFNLNFLSQIPQDVAFGFLIIWYLLLLGFVIEQFLQWYFNIYIVTNMHLVDINFYNLLYRNVTENKLDDIQSVSSSISGIIESLFHFGDVIVETAAERQKITFLNVPKPDIVADRIQDLQGLIQKKHGI